MINKIKKKLKKSEHIFSALKTVKYKLEWWFLSDTQYIKSNFKQRQNREVDLVNPILFNDKIQWLKLNWYDPFVHRCVDKYLVRDVVKERGCEKYLNKLYGVYYKVEEIDFNKLPKSFVFRCNHGSGYNIICKDKSEMDWDKEKKKLKKWLKTDYYKVTREWPYKGVKPCILCEEYLEEKDNGKLIDYKFSCYNGEPKFFYHNCFEDDKVTWYIYDEKHKLIHDEIGLPITGTPRLDKFEKFDEMIEVCKKLAKGFPFSRIDLYCPKDRIVFGEITFFCTGGFNKYENENYEKIHGMYLKLPNKINSYKDY